MLRPFYTLFLPVLLLSGCDPVSWNNPYPPAQGGKKVMYASFAERPKHLDPVRSYSSDEYTFIAQIYEPPLQYHYLKRPYRLIPLTAEALPQPRLLDEDGNELPADAPAHTVARSVYRVRIRSGIRYQPHPALVKDETGRYRYHNLEEGELDGVSRLSDFEHVGSRELVAEDYVYQIKRLSHPRLHSPIAGIMQEYILGMRAYAETLAEADRVAGSDGFLDLRKYPHPGVRAVDRYSYEITLEGSYPQLLYWLAMPFFAPIPWEAERFYNQPGMEERNITLDWYPIGSGPYMLAENNPSRRMVLARNPNFHGESYPTEGEPGDEVAGLLKDAGRAMPFIDRAVYSLEKETIPYWNKFLQGYYDASAVNSDSFDQAIRLGDQGDPALTKALADKGIELVTAVSASIFYTGFNMLDPVVGGSSERARKLRRAISIALDFEEYVAIFANGRGISAQGPLPPGIPGYREGREGINPYIYDWMGGAPQRKPIKEARRLLDEAGYPGGTDPETGKPLILYLDARAVGPDDKARLDWLRKQFDKLGVQLVIRGTDYNRFREKMRKGTFQIFQWGWNADYPDPENFMFLLYGPNGKVQHGGENAANYANPAFDRLFEEMKNMANGPRRLAIIGKMMEIIRRDAPWIWGWHPKNFSLHHGWYRNHAANLMANNTLKYLRIEPLERERKRSEWNRPRLWPVVLAVLFLLITVVPAIGVYRRREREVAR